MAPPLSIFKTIAKLNSVSYRKLRFGKYTHNEADHDSRLFFEFRIQTLYLR